MQQFTKEEILKMSTDFSADFFELRAWTAWVLKGKTNLPRAEFQSRLFEHRGAECGIKVR